MSYVQTYRLARYVAVAESCETTQEVADHMGISVPLLYVWRNAMKRRGFSLPPLPGRSRVEALPETRPSPVSDLTFCIQVSSGI
jgi:transposase-like protein